MHDFKTTKIMKKGDDGEGYNDGNWRWRPSRLRRITSAGRHGRPCDSDGGSLGNRLLSCVLRDIIMITAWFRMIIGIFIPPWQRNQIIIITTWQTIEFDSFQTRFPFTEIAFALFPPEWLIENGKLYLVCQICQRRVKYSELVQATIMKLCIKWQRRWRTQFLLWRAGWIFSVRPCW